MIDGDDVINKADKKLVLGWVGGMTWLLVSFAVIVGGVCGSDDAIASDADDYVAPPVITDIGNADDSSSTQVYDSTPAPTVTTGLIENEYSKYVCSDAMAEKVVEQATHYASLLQDPATELEERTVLAQITACPRGGVDRVADPFHVLALLRLESDLGVPEEASGILSAVWCIEAAMRLESYDGSDIRGDPRGLKKMAHGPMQLWPRVRSLCGLTDGGADDLFASATCYWQRVAVRQESTSLKCKSNSWQVAEALVANAPKYAGSGCAAESAHWRVLNAVKQTLRS